MRIHSHPRILSLGQYRGALWGMFAGGPIGLAISMNLAFADASTIIAAILLCWVAGGFCGHNMQALLHGLR